MTEQKQRRSPKTQNHIQDWSSSRKEIQEIQWESIRSEKLKRRRKQGAPWRTQWKELCGETTFDVFRVGSIAGTKLGMCGLRRGERIFHATENTLANWAFTVLPWFTENLVYMRRIHICQHTRRLRSRYEEQVQCGRPITALRPIKHQHEYPTNTNSKAMHAHGLKQLFIFCRFV